MAKETKFMKTLREKLKIAHGKLDSEIALTIGLRGEILTINDTRKNLQSTVKAKQNVIDQLKRAIAELERNNARLEGYVERINQNDRAQYNLERPTSAPVHRPFGPEGVTPFGSPSKSDSFTNVSAGELRSYQNKPIDWFDL